MMTVLRLRARFSRAQFYLAVFTIAATAMAATSATAATADNPPAPAPADAAPITGEASKRLAITGRASDRNSLRGDGIRIRARVAGAGAGRTVARLQVRRVGRRGWRQVAAKHVRSGKKFTIRWRGGAPGRYLTRVIVRKGRRAAVDRMGAIYVYRATFASWYGPGFMGNRTACGQRLTGSILGVAHKTLPCGTRVTFHLHGRTVTARVIDRGPYAHGRDWDLTPALKHKLHFGSTGTVHTTS